MINISIFNEDVQGDTFWYIPRSETTEEGLHMLG